MDINNILIDDIVNTNDYKYESKVIEKIQIVNSEEEKERVLKANKDAKVATKEEAKDYKSLDLSVEKDKNVYMNNKSELYALSDEKKLRFTKDLEAIDQAYQDNLNSFWSWKTAEQYAPLIIVGAAVAASVGTFGVGAPVASIGASVALTTLGNTAVSKGIEAYKAGVENDLNAQLNEVYKVVVEGKSKTNINNLFDDPYINSFSKILSQQYTNDEYMFSPKLRDQIVDLEMKKIDYSQLLSTYVENHKALKDNPNRIEEFNKNQEEFKNALASYNELKASKIQHIENEIEKIKATRDPSSEIYKLLMDSKTFNSLSEIKFINDIIGNLDKNENLKPLNSLDDMEKIRFNLTILDLAADQGLLFNKNTNIKDYDSNNYSSKKEIEKLKDILNKLADSQENQGMSLTDKFANLSNEERNSFLTRYSKVSNGINEHINKQIDNIKPEHQYLVSNLKGKDFINVSEIAKISQKLVDREAIELAEKESKEKLEIETSKTSIPNAFDNNI